MVFAYLRDPNTMHMQVVPEKKNETAKMFCIPLGEEREREACGKGKKMWFYLLGEF